MYRLEIAQPRRTSGVLTHVKVILLGKVFNTLSLSLITCEDMTRLTTFISRVEPLREPEVRPTSGSHSQVFEDPVLVPPTSNPL